MTLRSLLYHRLFPYVWGLHDSSRDDDVQTWEEPTTKSQRAGSKKQSQDCPGGCWGHLSPRLELPLASHLPSPEAGARLPALLGWGSVTVSFSLPSFFPSSLFTCYSNCIALVISMFSLVSFMNPFCSSDSCSLSSGLVLDTFY